MKEIYCLPGTMCDDALWQLLRPLLGDISLRHIELPLGDSIEAVVTSLADRLPTQPCHLLGFSFGGYLASAFTLTYPDRVKQLMLVSNTATSLTAGEVTKRQQALDWILEHGYQGIPDRKAKAMLASRNKNSDYLIELIKQMDARLGASVLIQQLSCSLERPELLNDLAGLANEVCFCVGREDTLLELKTLNTLDKGVQFTSYCAENCGHMVPLEQPLWLARKITRYFRF